MRASSFLPLALVGATLASPWQHENSGAASTSRDGLNDHHIRDSPNKHDGYFPAGTGSHLCRGIGSDHSHGGGASIRCPRAVSLVTRKIEKRTKARRCRHSTRTVTTTVSVQETHPLVTSTAELASITVTETNAVFPTLTAPGLALPPSGEIVKRKRRDLRETDHDMPEKRYVLDSQRDSFYVIPENQIKGLSRRGMAAPTPLDDAGGSPFVTVSTAGGTGLFAAAKEQKTNAAAQNVHSGSADTASAAAASQATVAVAASTTALTGSTPAAQQASVVQVATPTQSTSTQPTLIAQSEILYVPASNVVSSGHVLYYSSGSIDLPIPTPGVVSPPEGWASDASSSRSAALAAVGLIAGAGIMYTGFM